MRMNQEMVMLQGYIQSSKLQTNPLHHRTGKLQSSIRYIPAVVEGNSVVGSVEGGGGVAPYGVVQEYGGTFSVRGYMRRTAFNTRGEQVKLLTKHGLTSTRSSIASVDLGTVRPHTITFPERSFMRVSLAEKEAEIVAGLAAGIHEGAQ
jgi:hypothetical protein